MASGIIAAAGKGTRMGGSENKVFLKILGKTVLEHTVDAFFRCSEIEEIIIVTGKEDIDRCRELFKKSPKPVKVVCGGETRQKSVYNGIVEAKGDIVAIHDGARALIEPELIKKAIDECKICSAAALGVNVKDTIKIISKDGFIINTPEREFTYQIQTPQVFSRDLILKAHKEGENFAVTDDCALVERLGIPVKAVAGSYENIKLTTPEDMILAEGIMKKREIKKLLAIINIGTGRKRRAVKRIVRNICKRKMYSAILR